MVIISSARRLKSADDNASNGRSVDGVLRTALSAWLSIVSTRSMLSAPLINATSSAVKPLTVLLQDMLQNDSIKLNNSVVCRLLIVIKLAVCGWTLFFQ